MKKVIFVLILSLFCSSFTAIAKPKGNLIRGGLGFLFPDANSFSNPGQFAMNQATSVEAYYTRQNLSQAQSVLPSLVYGNGQFGLGAYAGRSSSNLASVSSTDTVGVGAGVGLMKNKMTIGAGYDRITSSANNNKGTVRGMMNFNPAGMGPSLGVGGFSTLNSGTKTQGATVGLGYIARAALFEINALSNDLKNSKDQTGSAFLTLQTARVYLGGGYSYLRLAAAHAVQTRVGMLLGSTFDLSLHAEKVLLKTSQPTFGASVRAAF